MRLNNDGRADHMSKLVVSEFVTLDGVMEAPGGEFHPDGKGAWTFDFFNEEALKFKQDELSAADALLLGRVTYQHFAAAWPSMTDEAGFADRMNGLPKYVVSTTLSEPLEWNATLLKGNLADEVAELKQHTAQDVLIFGSADLVHTLMQQDLVDEYRLMVFPVVLGSGKRLFRDGIDKQALRLAETKTFGSGVVVLSYQPAGKNDG
jgi:dihydrofolate reductase